MFSMNQSFTGCELEAWVSRALDRADWSSPSGHFTGFDPEQHAWRRGERIEQTGTPRSNTSSSSVVVNCRKLQQCSFFDFGS